MESRLGQLDVYLGASEVSQSTLDVCYLVSCAVRGEIPDTGRVASMGLDAVYDISREHFLVSACATALESAGVTDERFVREWGKAVRRTALMDVERSRLFSLMDAAGVWHVPLKGCVLGGMYPAYGMRQMADNDVLFDASRAEEVRDMMVSLGFTCEHYGSSNHDVYFKEPVCNFELHRKLFSLVSGERIYDYYADVERMLVPDGAGTYGMHLTDEDLYVYIVAHAKKHFSGAGIGLRILFDTYVYVRERGGMMDWDYVRAELTKLDLVEFEATCRDVATRLVDGEELSPEDLNLLAYLADSGAYGTLSHQVANNVARQGRLKYLVRRLFKPYKLMRIHYPVLDRLPVLLPMCWVIRMAKSLHTRRKVIFAEFETALGRNGM